MSMRRLRGWLFACLFSLGMIGSPVAWAVFCPQVFPANATQGGVDLSAGINQILGSVSPADYSTFDSDGTHYDTAGQWFYNSGSLGTWGVITVKAGETTWLFFDGDLDLQPNSTINPVNAALNSGGNPEDLIIIVRGNLEISTHNDINALIYATGNVTVQPNSNVLGAITAKGTVTIQNPGNTTVTYDADAAAGFDMPGVCDPLAVDHYRLEYSSPGLTCQPHSVKVSACGDSACSVLVAAGGSLVARDTATGNDVASVGFATLETGPAAVQLPEGMPAEVDLRVAAGATQCNVLDCRLQFSGSALQVTVPDLVAGQADVLTVAHCLKDFDGKPNNPETLPVRFWSSYLDPGTGSKRLLVSGAEVGRSEAEATTFTLSFVDGRATLPVAYFDAGLLQLEARGNWSKGGGNSNNAVAVAGISPPFVSRPFALRLDAGSLAGGGCSDAGGALVLDAAGCAAWPAGDVFSLGIQAVAADGSTTTPNFRLDNIELASELLAPADGVNGSLSQPDYDHLLGDTTTLSLRQSEVGIFRISATPRANAYFGYTVGGGEALIGRFTPAYLGVTSTASLNPACGTFSYQGQVIPFAGGQPQLAVTGYNREGEVTRNYDREPFWRLAPPLREAYSLSTAASKPNLAGRLQSLGDAQSLAVVDSGGADGRRVFDWRAEGTRQADALLWQLPSPPTSEDLPFTLSAASEHVALRVPAAGLTDADGICYRGSDGTAASCQDFGHAFGGTEVRVGRLRIDDASGPQDQPLDLPYWLESWQGPEASPVFGPTSGDSCSLGLLGEVQLSGFTGDLQSSHFPTPPGSLEAASGTPLPTGVIRLPAPNHTGSVLASLSGLNGATPVLPWLRFDWNGDGSPEAPTGLATFGVYSGPRALIFRRELYR